MYGLKIWLGYVFSSYTDFKNTIGWIIISGAKYQIYLTQYLVKRIKNIKAAVNVAKCSQFVWLSQPDTNNVFYNEVV